MVQGWLRYRAVRVVVGVAVGAVVGLAIYQASNLTGRNLFLLCGACAGAVAAVVVHGYTRTVRLTELTVSVPQFSQLRFAVTKDSREVAWKLFVESVTRISIQPLDADDGLIREAMTSLYGLFATTRDILKLTQPSAQTGKDPTVEHLAIAMLNRELRPFLSRWHPALLAWEQANPDGDETSWPHRDQCRTELAAVQQRLQTYVLGYGRLAGVPDAQRIVAGTLGPMNDSGPVHTPSSVRTPSSAEPPPPRSGGEQGAVRAG